MTYLVGNRMKNIVKAGVGGGGGTGVDNAQIYSTQNLFRLHVGGYTPREVTSELLAGHPKGPTSYPMTRELPTQPRPRITYNSLCSCT